LAQEIFAATAPPMGRKPLGGIGDKTVMVPMRWPQSVLDRIKATLLDGEDRSALIREAVERELERRRSPDVP
jgi:hypothetical protein